MMTFDEAMLDAARRAERAVKATVQKYARRRITDEPEITGALIGRLDAEFDGAIGGLVWDCSILRNGRGSAGEERDIGADILLTFKLETPTHRINKGVLIQAKRVEADDALTPVGLSNLHDQCKKMLAVTPASFVFDYTRRGFRCASANKIGGMVERDLYANCDWTSYRFFREFFRCPVGDNRITSGLVKDLPTPYALALRASGEFNDRHKL
jgi:hypothetical protein